MSKFKIAHSPKGTFVYPFPVDKTRLYLIVAQDLEEAEKIKEELDLHVDINPLLDSRFKRVGLHGDGITVLLQKCGN